MRKNNKSDNKAMAVNLIDRTDSEQRQVVLKGFEHLLSKGRKQTSRVKALRLERMMSKAELARLADLSPLTITRIEKGFLARLETKRKILEALGLSPADRNNVFFDEE